MNGHSFAISVPYPYGWHSLIACLDDEILFFIPLIVVIVLLCVGGSPGSTTSDDQSTSKFAENQKLFLIGIFITNCNC